MLGKNNNYIRRKRKQPTINGSLAETEAISVAVAAGFYLGSVPQHSQPLNRDTSAKTEQLCNRTHLIAASDLASI